MLHDFRWFNISEAILTFIFEAKKKQFDTIYFMSKYVKFVFCTVLIPMPTIRLITNEQHLRPCVNWSQESKNINIS